MKLLTALLLTATSAFCMEERDSNLEGKEKFLVTLRTAFELACLTCDWGDFREWIHHNLDFNNLKDLEATQALWD